MVRGIIVETSETRRLPRCGHRFHLSDGVPQQATERRRRAAQAAPACSRIAIVFLGERRDNIPFAQ